ncbi:MAG: penicillin-binding protein 1B [Proteobacteria bacterium]|nr:penicillin-binding protein 1B [Pseudomonadota bacterium]
MGERTVREVLKRRSEETLRKIQSRRDRKKHLKGRRSGRRRVFMVLLILLLLGAGWAGWLAWSAQSAFMAHQWAVPARVYARALELYPGRTLTVERLTAELQRLGYEQRERTGEPGTFAVFDNSVQFITRAFRFWDGEQPSLAVNAVFRGGKLAELSGPTGDDLFLVRLEPPLIGSLFPSTGEDRILVRLDEVPPALVGMLLAIEDRRFYEHHGVDPRAVARALGANVSAGEITQGGSTLTQQLVKNFYLSPERTFIRKANEAVMALAIDARFEKEEILEAYLNEVYLGQDGQRAIHGFGLGSYFYFQKPLRELDAEELALMVGLIRGPTSYDPRRHPERALERRNLVLSIAAEQDALEPKVAEAAIRKSIRVTEKPPQGTSYYPAFMELLKDQLRREYNESDLTREGLQVFSTLDPEAQLAAERALANGLSRVESSRGIPAGSLEGAVVVTSIEGAEVHAIVGGREARFAGFNRAISAVRPIGSLVKPFVYLSALESPGQWTLVTPVDDSPVEVALPDGTVWRPRNFQDEYHGEVPLLEALSRSYNAATVRVGMEVGVADVIRKLQASGFGRTPNAYPSVLLGALTMTPLEVAQAYNTLAGGGFRSNLSTIREVLRPDGTPLQRYPLEVRGSLDTESVYLLNRALQQVARDGTAAAAGRALGITVAGKTGTTDDFRDSWFAGYSGDRLAVTWVGRDDNAPAGLTGASGALPVWISLMQDIAQESFRPVKPAGVDEVWIDMRTGRRATEQCASARQLPFTGGSAPTNQPVCGSGLMDKVRDIFQ